MNKIPKDRRLKEATKAGSFYTIWTKKQYIWEEWTKERGLGLGELISKEVTRVVYIAFLAPNSVSGDEAASLPLGTGRAPFTRGGFISCSHRHEGGSECPSCTAVPWVTLIQHNHDARVAYFGVAYYATLHLHNTLHLCNNLEAGAIVYSFTAAELKSQRRELRCSSCTTVNNEARCWNQAVCSVSQTLNHYIELPPNGKFSIIPATVWFASQRSWVDYRQVLCRYSVHW